MVLRIIRYIVAVRWYSGQRNRKARSIDRRDGIHWSKYWTENNLQQKYGERIKYDHCYPDYFPLSESNPQDCWCYPENALGEFRKWLREIYIGEGKFKNYLDDKIKKKMLPASFSQLAIAAYGVKDD